STGRVKHDVYDKEHIGDFALWKAWDEEDGDALYRADVLMIECSFIADDAHDRAVKYRHIHFDDIAEFAERFENRIIVLTHFSRRYSCEEIVTTLRRRCPAVLRDRLRLAFAAPFDRIV